MSQILCRLNNAFSQVVHMDVSADVDLLHFAVTKGLKEHVRILLEHGFVLELWNRKVKSREKSKSRKQSEKVRKNRI